MDWTIRWTVRRSRITLCLLGPLADDDPTRHLQDSFDPQNILNTVRESL
jgi:hypothetical protein